MRPGNNSGSYYQTIHKHMSWFFQSYNTYRAEMTVRVSKTFKSNWEAHITRANNILNLEIGELARKAQLLNDTSIFTCSQLWIIFRLCSCHYHFARCKDQGSCFWFSNTHNDGGKTLIIRWVYQCPIKKHHQMTTVCTFGLYSALRAWSAIVLRSKRQSRLTVATIFLQVPCSVNINNIETNWMVKVMVSCFLFGGIGDSMSFMR